MKNNERYELNKELAQMLKGGVIMDVTTPEQAKIAEAAGACAVMALERIPADIRAAGGVSRMSDPKMIQGIQNAVSIPVMAKCRIGHFVEAQVLEAIEIDYIDESEVLSPPGSTSPSKCRSRSFACLISNTSAPSACSFFSCSIKAPCTAKTAIVILSPPFIFHVLPLTVRFPAH